MTSKPASLSDHEKSDLKVTHAERTPSVSPGPDNGDLVYEDEDEEPVLHHRTWFALAALFCLNYVQVVALTGPTGLMSYISKDVTGGADHTWIPNALSLVQAVGSPIISFASDTFQARKMLLLVTCTISFVGAAIGPGAKDMYRVIIAQILVGFGFAAVPLAYAIPSEIMPRRWRPVMNVAAQLGALTGSLVGGAFSKISPHKGWRNLYWLQMGLWGVTVLGILVGYRPPKRHTRLDHLTFMQKLARLDLPGMTLLTIGLSLLLAGLTLGNNPWEWSNVRVLTTLIIGIAVLIAFGLYEWKGTKTGVLNHELFGNRTFPLSIGLIFIEGIMLFSIVVFYPVLTTNLFEPDPMMAAVRATPFWIGAGLGTVIYGVWSTKTRTIRFPMFVGLVILTAGHIGMATVQPGQSVNAIVFDGMAGLGFGGPLVLILAAVQLSTPHHLIATGTAVLTSSRAIAASTFTAIYSAAESSSIKTKVPQYVGRAAVAAGLSTEHVKPFVAAISGTNSTAVNAIPGTTPAMVQAGLTALAQARADSYRLVYIIATPFGVLACVMVYFLDDFKKLMTYRVDAPIEELHAKHNHDEGSA